MTASETSVLEHHLAGEALEEAVADDDQLFAELFQLADLLRPFAIRAAAELGVADHLARGPMAVEDLAAACGAEVRPLHSTLRFLATRGIFAEVRPGWFAMTPLAAPLRSGVGPSLRDTLVSPLERRFGAAISHLPYSLRTGSSAYEDLFGESLFDFCQQDAAARHDLDTQFQGDVSDLSPILCDAHDWSGVVDVVDVGGGTGRLLSAILAAHPNLRGTLLDLPGVVADAAAVVADAGVGGRCRLVAGDFFAGVPSGSDRYLLSNVLLNWDDDKAIAILASCRAAMKDGSRLLVVERALPPGNEPHYTKYLDVHLLVTCGGMQRTRSELEDLISSAGFELRRVMPVHGAFTLLEAVPGDRCRRARGIHGGKGGSVISMGSAQVQRP